MGRGLTKEVDGGTVTGSGLGILPSTAATGASFVLVSGNPMRYWLAAGVWEWTFNELDFTLPSDMTGVSSFCVTVQKGSVVAGVWTPDPNSPWGTEQQIADNVSLGFTKLNEVVKLLGDGSPPWDMPLVGDLYSTFRFRIYATSILTGANTLQTCWSGGVDHWDLSPTIPSVASVSAVEATNARYQDQNSGNKTVINFTVTVANNQVPQIVTILLNKGDGLGWYSQGPFNITTSPQICPVQEWLPTLANGTWQAAAVAGDLNLPATPVSLPSGAVTSSTFTVPMVGLCPATDCTGFAITNYQTFTAGDGTQEFGFTLGWTNPTIANDPAFFDAQVTVQEGTGTGSGFTPVSDVRGSTPAGQAAGTVGRQLGDNCTPGAAVSINVTGWGISGNTFRIRLYAVSRQGTSAGTATLQATLEFVPTTSGLDLTKVNPSTIGNGLTKDGSGNLTAKVGGAGVSVDGSGNLTLRLGNGMTYSANSLIPSLGNGLTNSSGPITLNLGSGLAMSGSYATVQAGNGISVSGAGVSANLGNGLTSYLGQIQLNLGNGLAFNGSTVQINTGNGMSASGGALTLNLGTGLSLSGSQVVANLGNGLTSSAGAITLNLGGGLTMSGSVATVNTGTGLTVSGIQLIISNNGVGPSQISSVNVSQLNAGTMTVGSTLTLSGSGGLALTGGGGISVITPAQVYAQGGFNVMASPAYGYGIGGSLVIDGNRNGNFATVAIGGTTAINSANQFTGSGILIGSNGIQCGGVNPYIGGSQYYGANTSFVVNGTTYNVRGGIITTG